jgi:hypothetical protein
MAIKERKVPVSFQIPKQVENDLALIQTRLNETLPEGQRHTKNSLLEEGLRNVIKKHKHLLYKI